MQAALDRVQVALRHMLGASHAALQIEPARRAIEGLLEYVEGIEATNPQSTMIADRRRKLLQSIRRDIDQA